MQKYYDESGEVIKKPVKGKVYYDENGEMVTCGVDKAESVEEVKPEVKPEVKSVEEVKEPSKEDMSKVVSETVQAELEKERQKKEAEEDTLSKKEFWKAVEKDKPLVSNLGVDIDPILKEKRDYYFLTYSIAKQGGFTGSPAIYVAQQERVRTGKFGTEPPPAETNMPTNQQGATDKTMANYNKLKQGYKESTDNYIANMESKWREMATAEGLKGTEADKFVNQKIYDHKKYISENLLSETAVTAETELQKKLKES